MLSQDGIMRFINIQTFKQLFEIGSIDNALTAVTICPKGRHIVAVTESGALNIYSVQGLTQEVNKVVLQLDAIDFQYSACRDFSCFLLGLTVSFRKALSIESNVVWYKRVYNKYSWSLVLYSCTGCVLHLHLLYI